MGDADYWSFARGDTLVILDYVGEGRYNVWDSEWWVHASLSDGRRGWFLADTTVRFRGADACGGPIE